MAEQPGASAPASTNLAARMGLWSARHRKLAIFGWFGAVVLVFVLGGIVGTKTLNDADAGVGESGRATQIYASGDPESVLIQSARLTAREPAFLAAVKDVAGALARQPGVSELDSPYARGNEGQISNDGHSALIQFRFGAEADLRDRPIDIQSVEAAVERAAVGHPGVYVGEYGDASATKAIDDTTGKD